MAAKGSDNSTTNRGFAAMDKKTVSKIAQRGAAASTGKFGSKNGADPSVAGRAGPKRSH